MKRSEVIDSPGLGHEVKQLWVALVESSPGNESVPAALIPGAVVTLFVADPKRLPWLQRQAQTLARDGGKLVRIACFSKREDLEAYEP